MVYRVYHIGVSKYHTTALLIHQPPNIVRPKEHAVGTAAILDFSSVSTEQSFINSEPKFQDRCLIVTDLHLGSRFLNESFWTHFYTYLILKQEQ